MKENRGPKFSESYNAAYIIAERIHQFGVFEKRYDILDGMYWSESFFEQFMNHTQTKHS